MWLGLALLFARVYTFKNINFSREHHTLYSLSDYILSRKNPHRPPEALKTPPPEIGIKSMQRWGRRFARELKTRNDNFSGHLQTSQPEPESIETLMEYEAVEWPPPVFRKASLTNWFKNNQELPTVATENYMVFGRSVTIYTPLTGTPTSVRLQADPFAPPSNIRIRLPQDLAQFPPEFYNTRIHNIALSDYIARKAFEILDPNYKVFIVKPTQLVLERSSIVINNNFIELRLFANLPSHGRRISGDYGAVIYCQTLPKMLNKIMKFEHHNYDDIKAHISSIQDQEFLRNSLDSLGLVAFIKDGSNLPRVSGVSDEPLTTNTFPFESPDTLRVEVELPNSGKVSGMGIKKGVTLIIGGGYHGKSTLLEALQMGVYNKIPGDGREFAVTSPKAVKIRSHDGRPVTRCDISNFIGDLPNKKTGSDFSTADASGSTSQAASIMESIELGADTLLLDEDISASNLLYRDNIMEELVSSEPITQYLNLIRPFYKKLGVSTILITGSCGRFLEKADTVIQMNKYKPIDLTEKVKDFFKNNKNPVPDVDIPFTIPERIISPESFTRSKKIRHIGKNTITHDQDIDLSDLGQLCEWTQTNTITNIIIHLEQYFRSNQGLREMLEKLYQSLEGDKRKLDLDIGVCGLDNFTGFKTYPVGDLTMPRLFEVGAAINRMRSLIVSEIGQNSLQEE